MNPDEKPSANRWPAQIKYIVGNEACERFSFYGMKSILAGYIAGEAARGTAVSTETTVGISRGIDDAARILEDIAHAGNLAAADREPARGDVAPCTDD